MHGARAVLQQGAKQSSGLSAWLAQLTSRTHRNVAAVALANKLARMAWAKTHNRPLTGNLLAAFSRACRLEIPNRPSERDDLGRQAPTSSIAPPEGIAERSKAHAPFRSSRS